MEKTPKIIQFGFRNFIQDQGRKRRKAVCNVCDKKISDTLETTSNFVRHYKLNKKR